MMSYVTYLRILNNFDLNTNKFSVKAVLEKFFGTKVQDRTIKQLKRSAWQGDENTMGVNSYPKVGEWKRKKK